MRMGKSAYQARSEAADEIGSPWSGPPSRSSRSSAGRVMPGISALLQEFRLHGRGGGADQPRGRPADHADARRLLLKAKGPPSWRGLMMDRYMSTLAWDAAPTAGDRGRRLRVAGADGCWRFDVAPDLLPGPQCRRGDGHVEMAPGTTVARPPSRGAGRRRVLRASPRSNRVFARVRVNSATVRPSAQGGSARRPASSSSAGSRLCSTGSPSARLVPLPERRPAAISRSTSAATIPR